LSARLGDLVLTDKEVSGIVIKDVGSVPIPKPKWVAVGKACTPRKIVMYAKDIGENRFVVRFESGRLETCDQTINFCLLTSANGKWKLDINRIRLNKYL
jgi:hypothetical protein